MSRPQKGRCKGNLHVRRPIHLKTVSPVHRRSNSGIFAGQNAQKIKVAHYIAHWIDVPPQKAGPLDSLVVDVE